MGVPATTLVALNVICTVISAKAGGIVVVVAPVMGVDVVVPWVVGVVMGWVVGVGVRPPTRGEVESEHAAPIRDKAAIGITASQRALSFLTPKGYASSGGLPQVVLDWCDTCRSFSYQRYGTPVGKADPERSRCDGTRGLPFIACIAHELQR